MKLKIRLSNLLSPDEIEKLNEETQRKTKLENEEKRKYNKSIKEYKVKKRVYMIIFWSSLSIMLLYGISGFFLKSNYYDTLRLIIYEISVSSYIFSIIFYSKLKNPEIKKS